MKIFTSSIVTLLIVSFALVALGLTGLTIVLAIQPVSTPSLGAAETYGILSNHFEHDVAATTITGNPANSASTGILGYSDTAGAGAIVVVNGIAYINDATWTAAGNAQNAALALLNDMGACTPIDTPATPLNGIVIGANPAGTFPPGCYTSAGAMNIADGTTVTLKGAGTYIFRSTGGALGTGANSHVVLDGASACDVFWTPAAATTLGANSTFVGTIIDPSGVTMSNLAAATGRILAYGGTVTADSNSITLPICAATTATLTLRKTRTNDNGGSAAATAWTLTATGPTTPISGATESGAVTGVVVTPGTYTLSEAGPSGYTPSLWNCTNGVTVTSSQITLSAGQSTVCTIDNNDNAPSLTLDKIVVNDNGGTALESAWTLTANGGGAGTLSGFGAAGHIDVVSGSTFKAGTYALSETGSVGYTASAWSCVKNGAVPVPGASIVLGLGDVATCTITNDDIAPQLTVIKTIINDNGGTKLLPSNFSFFIDGFSVTSGVASTTSVGLHTVSETPDASYATTIGGNCAANGTITLAPGDIKTCTITNDDIAPVAHRTRSSQTVAVPPLIDVVKVPSPLALPNGPGPVTYTYTLHNIGIVPVTNITMVDDTCSPITLVSGDANSNAILETNETWTYTCTSTLSKTHTNIVTTTGRANDITATDIASATVVVGASIVPPLIHVTKVPSPLALPNGAGMVTYTEKISNPGIVALSNVLLTDDKCSPLQYVSGDINGNSKLDTTETWVYTCRTNLTKTTTNTASASGEANGLTARDFAIATVVVASPALPNTGLPSRSRTPWDIFITAGILMVISTSLVLALKKRFV